MLTIYLITMKHNITIFKFVFIFLIFLIFVLDGYEYEKSVWKIWIYEVVLYFTMFLCMESILSYWIIALLFFYIYVLTSISVSSWLKLVSLEGHLVLHQQCAYTCMLYMCLCCQWFKSWWHCMKLFINASVVIPEQSLQKIQYYKVTF